MPTSIFFKSRFERPFPVSFLLLEAVAFLASQESEDEEGVGLAEVVSRALIDCEVVAPGEVTEDDITYVLTYLKKVEAESEEGGSSGKKTSKKPGFAVEYSKWISGLTVEETCIYAAGYDLAVAEEYYCSTDRDDVLLLAKCRMKRDWEAIRMDFESALYGFGGSYGEADKEGVKSHDLTEQSPEGMEMLNKMFNKA